MTRAVRSKAANEVRCDIMRSFRTTVPPGTNVNIQRDNYVFNVSKHMHISGWSGSGAACNPMGKDEFYNARQGGC